VSKEPVNVIVCLRSGRNFGSDHVSTFANMVWRNSKTRVNVIAITDVPGLGIPSITDWPGWWILIESFRIKGPCVMTGLDTVIVDNIDPLLDFARELSPEEFAMLTPFNRRGRFGQWASGFVVWNGDWSWIFDEMDDDAIEIFHYEQRYTASKVMSRNVKIKSVQENVSGIYSYKRDCMATGLPEDARVILFHGPPRVQDVEDPWVIEHWR